MDIKDKITISGRLYIKEGRALNQRIDNNGNLIDWNFIGESVSEGQNVICTVGLNFILARDWGLPMAIAIGNGSTTGANIPASTDTSLNSELDNARFGVRGNAKSRVKDGIVSLSALWSRGQAYSGTVTEFGLFINEEGTQVSGRNTGFMLARKALEYQKSDSTQDVELLWIIKFTA